MYQASVFSNSMGKDSAIQNRGIQLDLVANTSGAIQAGKYNIVKDLN